MPETLTAAKELAERAEARRGEQAGRIAMYDRYLSHYFQGRSWEEGAGAALDNYTDGRPALRAPGENAQSAKAVRAAPNYAKPIIKDLVSIKGQWPTVSVPPASGSDSDAKRAVLIRRGLVQQHSQSSMIRQQQRAGFYASCLGDAVYTLDPRTPKMDKEEPNAFRPVGIYYNVVNPRQAFPRFRQGGGDDDLEDLFWCARIRRDDCRMQYPGIRLDPDQAIVDVIHYYSRSERQTVVNGQRAYGIVHDLGFCPAEWIPNDLTMGGFGQSDIAGCLDLLDELSDLWKVYVDSIWGSVYPIYVIKDPDQTSGVLEYGPGAQFTTHGTGDVKVLAPQADAQSAMLIYNSAVDNLLKQAGISPVRIEGQIDRSNVSAKSVDRQQAPQEQRLKLGLDLQGQGLSRLNAKCLLMLSTIKDFEDTPMELYGQDKDGTYNETFSGADIGGWTRNVVKWDAMTGQTQQESTIQALQLYKEGEGMFPFEEVLVAARYDDPQEIMERGKAEAGEKAAMQQAMQPQGAPPGGAGGGGGAPGAAPPGAAPPVQPPPAPPMPKMPGFPPVAKNPTQRTGSPAPVPDVFSEVNTAIHSIPLRGTAEVMAKGNGWVIDVTDHRDVPAIKAAIKPIEQGLALKIAIVVRPATKVA
jgi:hypothetical protein